MPRTMSRGGTARKPSFSPRGPEGGSFGGPKSLAPRNGRVEGSISLRSPDGFSSRELAKFRVNITGPRMEAVKGPSSPKTSNIPEYRPSFAQNMSVARFGSVERAPRPAAPIAETVNSALPKSRYEFKTVIPAPTPRRTVSEPGSLLNLGEFKPQAGPTPEGPISLKTLPKNGFATTPSPRPENSQADSRMKMPRTVFRVNPLTQLSGDTQGNLSGRDVSRLLRQPAFKGSTDGQGRISDGFNTVRRLPDIGNTEPVNSRTSALEIQAKAVNPDRKVDSPQLISRPIVDRSPNRITEARKAEVRRQLQEIQHQEKPADSSTNERHVVIPEMPTTTTQQGADKFKIAMVNRQRRRVGLPPINPEKIDRAVAQGAAMDERETASVQKKLSEYKARLASVFKNRYLAINGARPEEPGSIPTRPANKGIDEVIPESEEKRRNKKIENSKGDNPSISRMWIYNPLTGQHDHMIDLDPKFAKDLTQHLNGERKDPTMWKRSDRITSAARARMHVSSFDLTSLLEWKKRKKLQLLDKKSVHSELQRVTLTQPDIQTQLSRKIKLNLATEKAQQLSAVTKPLAVVSQSQQTEVATQTTILSEVNKKKNAIQLFGLIIEKSEKKVKQFKFFKPAQQERMRQWADAVNKVFPFFDFFHTASIQDVVAQLDAPNASTASPLANEHGIPDGGDWAWRMKVTASNEAIVTRPEAIAIGVFPITDIRPVIESVTGPDARPQDVDLVFSGISKKDDAALAA
jgi:hypothetical protein